MAFTNFKDISISKKLYFTIGIMAILIVIELFVLSFAISTLSAVRSYVSGEGLWSKAQKDAILNLRLYAYSHDEADYQNYLKYLEVPLGDGKARQALEKTLPDYEMARQGFLEGRNHPDDIEGMIKLMLRFHDNKYLARTIFYWKKAEASMIKLIPVSEKLHRAVQAGTVDSVQTTAILREIDRINFEATPLEDNFSYTLGEGSRWFENLVLKLLIALALTVETTGIIIAVSISRGIQKGLNSILQVAERLTSGLFDHRAKVFSRDEIGTLALAFNQMADKQEQAIARLKESEINIIKQKNKAQASEKIKQVFIANISHEIRTPMNAIIGFARLLNESDLNKEQNEYIHAIVKSSEFLQILLTNMLDLAKIEAGKVVLEKKRLSVYENVSIAVAMLEAEALKKNLVLNFEINKNVPESVLGDESRLIQILINLITNAIKYTPSGSVSVYAEAIRENGDEFWIEFSVRDTGMGIPADKHSKIFESFEQLTHDHEFGGIGLGLSIVKQLVALNGGTVYVKSSTRNEGTDIRFVLPFTKFNRPAIEISSEKPALRDQLKDLRKTVAIKILVADDNSLNQLLIKKILLKNGYIVDQATDGEIAVAKYQEGNYDLILMDLDMPNMNGFEATEFIRKMPEPKLNIPIIAITAHATVEVKERCLANGMNDFISKPFQQEDLFHKINLYTNLQDNTV
jgi:signal transduction histidine kinase/ActR/RegA family two-component response regulator